MMYLLFQEGCYFRSAPLKQMGSKLPALAILESVFCKIKSFHD